MIHRYHTVADFFAEARAMRECFEAHFRNPYDQTADTHGIWNYWYVPGQYTYLRANPNRLMPPALVDEFVSTLRGWALNALGTGAVTQPQLHLYIDGCAQDLHSDFHNGLWGYVFSLTNWDVRRFSGGETQLMRDGALNHKPHHVHATQLYDLVHQTFNQLLVFDDSIVHAVRLVRGTLSPVEGRVVLTGHIGTTDPVVEGALSVGALKQWMRFWAPSLAVELHKHTHVRGWISFRITATSAGSVEAVDAKSSQLASDTSDERTVASAIESIIDCLRRSRLPPASGESVITLPIVLPIPTFQPITIQRPHDLPLDTLRSRLGDGFDSSGITATWDKNSCHFTIDTPSCSGMLNVQSNSLCLSLDLLMTRPSHRARLEDRLARLVNAALQS